LTGENPPEPESLDHIIVFGDCAIKSTKNGEFRTIRTPSDKNYIETIKGKIGKDQKSQKVTKVKEKTNKQVIEIPGCPPNLFESLNSILKYYGKSQAPNLSFYNNLIKTYYQQESSKKPK
jgi:Ni,Fe-hydrogenase I small subunit